MKKYLKFLFRTNINLRFIQKKNLYQFCMEAGKRTKETTEGSVPIKKGGNKIGGNFISTANPQFIKSRIQIYEEIMKDQKKFFEQASRREIKITLKDGKEIIGKCFETTPLEIAKKISKKLAENAVVAKVIFKNREKTLETGIIKINKKNNEKKKNKMLLILDLKMKIMMKKNSNYMI